MVNADIRTFKELAERSGTSRQTISSVKNGRGVDVDTIAKLSATLGVPAGELLKEEDK